MESIDCRAHHFPLNQGSLIDYRPPRPLCLLPYYHGRIPFDTAKRLLKQHGDYALFIDPAQDQLKICLCDDVGRCYNEAIVQRPDSLYRINGSLSHHQQGFPNVEQLIAYYEIYGLPVKDEMLTPGKYIRLENAIKVKADVDIPEENRRPFKEPGMLNHFHFVLSNEEAEMRLTKEGDFLVHQNPESLTDFIISIRGTDGVSHHTLEREPVAGLNYVLPRHHLYEPVESVYLLDELIQFHIMYSVTMHGKRLMNPVPRPKEADQKAAS